MKEIVIVGGGTAGWMSAVTLSAKFPDKTITVVDPTVISPIGIGESVTGAVLEFVRNPTYGLDFTDFLVQSEATFKMGIWFKDWTGPGQQYLNPIDHPPQRFEHRYPQDMEDFFAYITANGGSVCDEQIHSKLMQSNRTDFFRQTDGSISAQLSILSCHFDALKFAAWIKNESKKRANIVHIDSVMSDFKQDPETGLVTGIVTEQGQHIPGDFFFDCTGFRRTLFAPAYTPDWIDYSKYIKVDSAMPSFSEHDNDKPIPVYTLAQAMSSGWLWQVPTRSRLGSGYVYSSQYISDEEAIAEQRAMGIEIGDAPRILRFKPGKFATQMAGNVCAIGLAGGFIEPLESTTIHIMHVQIRALAELILPYYSHEARQALANKFNSLITTMYDDFVDFVSLHYRTGRTDTDFWRDYQESECLSPANRNRLETWKYTYPSREDFAPPPTNRFVATTGLLLWMPMLCGLGLLSRAAAVEVVKQSPFGQEATANLKKYHQIREFLVANGVTQKELIQHFS